MRIISGRYRRRKLLSNPGQTTRPITDRVKENLFEYLTEDLPNKRVIDVFAGTGSIGLEALSRGARSVVFIEFDHRAHELLRKNVNMVEADDCTMCWRADVLKTSFRPKGVDDMLPFDIAFFDPPYRMIEGLKAGSPLYKSLERLARASVTSPEALLLLRTPKGATFECPPVWAPDWLLEVSTMDIHLFKKREAEA